MERTEKNDRIVSLNSALVTTTLKVRGPNIPCRRQTLSNWGKKTLRLNCMLFTSICQNIDIQVESTLL